MWDVLGFFPSDLDIALGVRIGANALPPRHETSASREPGLLGREALLRHGLPPPQGLVAIPVSVFYSVPQQKHFDHYIRFCFVKVTGRAAGGRAGLPQLPRARRGSGEKRGTNLLAQDESTLRAMDKKLQEWKDELGA